MILALFAPDPFGLQANFWASEAIPRPNSPRWFFLAKLARIPSSLKNSINISPAQSGTTWRHFCSQLREFLSADNHILVVCSGQRGPSSFQIPDDSYPSWFCRLSIFVTTKATRSPFAKSSPPADTQRLSRRATSVQTRRLWLEGH